MKRRNLCNIKKLLAVILAASMCMSSGGVAFAESTQGKSVKANDTTENANNSEGFNNISDGGLNVSSVDGTPNQENDPDTKASATVTGDVINSSGSSENEAGQSAVKAKSRSESNTGSSAKTEVTVSGGAKAGNISTEHGVDAGVKAVAEAMGTKSDADTEVTVNGNVEANGSGSPTGVYASSENKDNQEGENTASTTVTVEGNVSAKTTGDGQGYDFNATGVQANSEQGKGKTAATEVNVKGDVSASSSSSGSSTGISASAFGEGASTKVDVKGKVSSDSSGTGSKGIKVDSNTYGGDVYVHVGKDVDVTYSGSTGSDVAGIDVSSYGASSIHTASLDGNIDIDVDGSVTVDSTGTAYGVKYSGFNSDAKVDIDIVKDVKTKGGNGSEAIYIGGVSNSLDLEVGGSVIHEGTGVGAINIEGGNSYSQTETVIESTPSIKVTVKENVTADTTAISINDSDADVDVTVGGTISGKDHNIVLMGESTTEKLDITVWKVDTSNNKNVVDTYDSNTGKYSKGDESVVNYIIKADSTEAKIAMSGQGEQRSDGTYVAKEGKEVYFSVDIPNGYTAEFYDVNDNTAYQIIPNGTGGAYISVPRGGGVYVGVRLTKTSNSGSNSGNTSGNNTSGNNTSGNNTSYSTSSGSSSSDRAEWTVSQNDNSSNAGGLFVGFEAVQGLQIHSMNIGGVDVAMNVGDVLKPVDTLTAINNFMATNTPTLGSNNVMGSGVVSFNNMFLNSVSDTVEVPVAASVTAGQTYTVMFSDGTSMTVPCAINGVLTIPFNKAAEGLTYIIYGLQMDPSMFIGMPLDNGWTP